MYYHKTIKIISKQLKQNTMKNLFFIALLSLIPMLTFGQIYVQAPDGNTTIGGDGTSAATEKLEVEGIAKMQGGTIQQNGGSASIVCERINKSAFAFGAGLHGGFAVDQDYHLEFRSSPRSSILNRTIANGDLMLRFRSGTGWAGFGIFTPASALHVNGSITYNGSLNNASDRRLKKNINTFNYGLEEVMQLNPVTYEYNGKANFRNAGQQQIGLIAQDLKAVAPELVSTFTHEEEDAESRVVKSEEYLMISESSIKYMLINATQEQQKIIDSQQETMDSQEDKIASLEGRLEQIEALLNAQGTSASQTIELGTSAELFQNQPNPFSETTRIQYSLNKDVQNAVMQITDINGSVLKTVRLENATNGEVIIKAQELSSGTYFYSLIADGQLISTKKMVLTK